MASSKPVHECLFCPQTFDSATAKDDHVLEHFAQETCTECNQHLIRIGSTLYSQHNATACIRMAVKSEILDKSSSDTPAAPQNVIQHHLEESTHNKNYLQADVTMLTSIKMEEIHIKEEPNVGEEQQDIFEILNAVETQSNDSGIPKIEWTNSQPEDNTVAWTTLQFDENLVNCDRSAFEEDKQQTIISMETSPASLEKGKISCDICGKVLSSKSALRTHTNLLHSQQCEEFECNVCKIKCKSKDNLRRHMITKHDPGKDKLRCRICHEVFMEEQSLHSHPCKRRLDPASCDVCGKVFRYRHSLRTHKTKLHNLEETIFCNNCGKIFDCVDDLNKHTSVCNVETKEECGICGKIFGSKTALRMHNDLSHSQFNDEFECYICKKKCKQKSNLRIHMILKHDPDKEKLKCKLCGQVYLIESSLQAHKCRDKVSCDVCGKIFKTRQSLGRHQIRLHSREGTIFCNVCAKIFDSVEDLNKHRSICYCETQEPCDICGKLLKSFSLKKHKILFHSPPGTIYCKICRRLFSTREELDTHRSVCILRKTTANCRRGPFECNICKKKFTLKASLDKHMIVIHDPHVDRLKCKQCKRVFMRESSLQTHQCKSKSHKP